MSTVIDSHHHFIDYSKTEYGWIGAGMEVLARKYLPQDLRATIGKAGVDGVISVQARQSISETNWLLGMAEQNDFIRGVVGWAPLIDADFETVIEALASHKKLVGLRHVLQDEADDRYMCQEDFDRGIRILEKHGLRYDLLVFPRQIAGSIELVDRHPNLTFILDHIAKPPIGKKQTQPWAGQLKELSRRPNVYCKVSGMATETDWKTWTAAELKPYFDIAIEAFSPSRVMFGSDWPVCLLATSYERWVETVRGWTAPLSSSEQNRIWGGTAAEAYGLES